MGGICTRLGWLHFADGGLLHKGPSSVSLANGGNAEGWHHNRNCNITSCTLRQSVILKSHFACRALAAELGASNVAAHRGQAAMPCVTHDLFVGDTIAVSRRDEPGAQAM